MKKIVALIVFAFTIVIANAQTPKIPTGSTLAAYCEYGSKGVKYAVLAYTDKGYRRFTILESSELNITLAKGLQGNGLLSVKDINAAIQSTSEKLNALVDKYKQFGLKEENTFYYVSSGLGLINNIQEFCDSVKSKTGKGARVVSVVEEAKYTIAGTIPYDEIANALVADQGSGNTKGGYVIVDGKNLTAITFSFDLGSTSVYNLIMNKYMPSRPDDKDEERQLFIAAMNRCADSLKIEVRNTFENIEGAQSRNKLYISGGAAYAITTILYPDADPNQQMIEVNYDRLRAFLTDIQDKDYYKRLTEKVYPDEKVQKNYTKALGIYNHLQLISATKLLLIYVNALSSDNKKIYFNTYGLHAMPSMLLGRVLRGDIPRW